MSQIYEPAGNARVNNLSHRFSAANMSATARRAARGHGLSTVGTFEIVKHIAIVDAEHQAELWDVVVIRAYSPSGRKAVDITAGDMYIYSAEYTDAPMAKVGR